jgi:hypothetical protein
MKPKFLKRTLKECRQNWRQARLSYFFVIDELRELGRLLRGRCPEELCDVITQLQEARQLNSNAQIDAITKAISIALSARLLLNSEHESMIARMIVTNIGFAAGDVLTQLSWLRREAELLIGTDPDIVGEHFLPVGFILGGLPLLEQGAEFQQEVA